MTTAPFSVNASGVTLAARIARPPSDSAGTNIAIHGGTYDSEYYDSGDDSLLTLGP